MNKEIPDNWYETFFSGINCEMWEKAASQEWTDAEVAFVIGELNVAPGSRILDMPCGTGRHSIELAKKGYRPVAVDISEEFINGLKKKAVEQQLNIDIVHGNILNIELNGPFDGAICLGNSFGYFTYDDMQTFVKKVAASLKAGAKWIINTGVVAESFLTRFEKEKKYELPGLTMEIKNEYDVYKSTLLTELTYTKDGRQQVQRFKHNVYTVAEITRLLEKYGLKIIALYNSTDRGSYSFGDPQLYLVCQK